jgi:hypothetical protein
MSMTRFPNGLSTARSIAPMGAYTHPDETDQHAYNNDFNSYSSTDWTITVVGSSTPALVAGDGGLLGITTSASSADSAFLQKTIAAFTFETGKPMWFAARFKVSTLATTAVIGLQVIDTTPLDVTDGIYFLTTTATGAVTGICRKNATTGSIAKACGTLVADTYTELAWYWDGKDTVNFYQDKVQQGSVTGVAANYLPDTTCTVSMGVQTDSANARTMTIDYIMVAKSRR